jgi:hypothetical protein
MRGSLWVLVCAFDVRGRRRKDNAEVAESAEAAEKRGAQRGIAVPPGEAEPKRAA